MIAYITELTDENYKGFVSKQGLVLVDVYATWCNPCKLISPIVDQISNDFYERVSVGKLDADKNRETLGELEVRNIPTILLYKNGEIVDKSVGMVSKEKLTEMINNHLDNE
jgi:thioredoxin 1